MNAHVFPTKFSTSPPARLSHLLLPFGTLAVALLLTACGGGGSSPSSGNGGTPTNGGGGSTVVSGGPIIGTLPVAASRLNFVAGSIGSPGSVDGPADVARFNNANHMLIDWTSNTVIIEDFGRLRKISASGQVNYFAGNSSFDDTGFTCGDGQGEHAFFGGYDALAAGNNGDIYVADNGCFNVRKVSSTGVVTTVAQFANLYAIAGLAFDRSSGNLYATVVTAFANGVYNSPQGMILQITPAGAINTFAGKPDVTGYADGRGSAAMFNQPTNIVADQAGNLFVNDCKNGTIRKIDNTGTVSTFIAQSTGMVHCPSQLTMEPGGNFVLVDSVSGITRLTAQGQVISTMPTPTINDNIDPSSPHTSAKLSGRPLAVDTSGNIVFSNITSVQRVSASGVVTNVAGLDMVSGDADGLGARAQFRNPARMVADAAGNLYQMESYNTDVKMRKITPDGVVTTVLAAQFGDIVDGVGAAARFGFISSPAMDPAGNIVVLDFFDSTPLNSTSYHVQQAIRKISPSGAVTTVYSKVYSKVFLDQFPTERLTDIAVDGAGTIYVLNNPINFADRSPSKILKMNNAGQLAAHVTLSAQIGGNFAVDAQGDVFAVFNDGTLRKTSPQGVETVIANFASFYMHASPPITIDAGGNFFVSTAYSVLRVTPQGVITTYLGSGLRSGTQVGTAPGGLYNPGGLTISGNTLYIAAGKAILATGP